MSIDNLEPIHNLTYAYHAPQENKFFIRHYRDWSYQDLLLNDDEAISILRNRVALELVHVMFTLQNISDISEMLKRIYKAQFKQEGKLGYRIYLELLQASLDYEEYKYKKNTMGYKTTCNQFDHKLADLWAKAKISQK
jgi:hypothetical protein